MKKPIELNVTMLARIETLSAKERDVLGYVGKGYMQAEICKALKVNGNTVQTHKSHIKRKLKLRDSGDLARVAVLHLEKQK